VEEFPEAFGLALQDIASEYVAHSFIPGAVRSLERNDIVRLLDIADLWKPMLDSCSRIAFVGPATKF